jgi:hypothetical protein
MNLIFGKDSNIYKKKSKSKSPKVKNKINNLKKITDSIMKKKSQNKQLKIGIQKSKNKNGSVNIGKSCYLNSYSNRKQYDPNITSNNNCKHDLYKRDKQYNSKQFIYIKKENLSNIVRQSNKKNYDSVINPFNLDNKNNNSLNNKNLSLSKSNKKYLNGGNFEYKEKDFNANFTSVNLIKNAVKNKKIKLEIGSKKKNKYRAKTLMEDDYLRDILMNNKDVKENANNKDKDNYYKDHKYYKGNKSATNNMSVNLINYNCNGIPNSKYHERKTNYSPSIKDLVIKSPSERHDINFNININMNNNDYKKLICYYHGHNSYLNHNYDNKKGRYSNISYNAINKKKDYNT